MVRPFPLVLAMLLTACSTAGVSDPEPTTRSTVAVASSAPSTIAPTAVPTPSPTAPPWDALPDPANDPTALAAQLVMAEGFIRDPNATAGQLAWAGHMEQLGIARLADFPEWADSVLAALPAEPRAAIAGSMEAGKQLRAYFDFKTADKEKIKIKFALSPVSTNGAISNLRSEIKDWDFERTKLEGQTAWNRELSKIAVTANSIFATGVFSECIQIMPSVLTSGPILIGGRRPQPPGRCARCAAPACPGSTSR